MGSVTIKRRKAVWRDRARAYEVLIDDQKVGKLKSGETARFALAPGQHQVRMKIDWCGSPTLTVDGGLDTQLVCDTGGTAFTVLFDIVLRINKYISLERA